MAFNNLKKIELRLVEHDGVARMPTASVPRSSPRADARDKEQDSPALTATSSVVSMLFASGDETSLGDCAYINDAIIDFTLFHELR